MEKRDIIIIIVAIFIVLFMAMYIKPLVTGKPVQLIPDELSQMLSGGNKTEANNTSQNNTSKQVTQIPKVTSINPRNFTTDGNNTTTVVIEGKNLTESMDSVTFVNDGVNQTFPTVLDNGTLVTNNVTLPEGNWTVKIVDNYTKVTYNTTRSIVVKAKVTPVPTWDGKPIPLIAESKEDDGTIYKSRPYPEDILVNITPMRVYSNFSDVRGAKIKSIDIPFNYFDVVYTVDYKTRIATPKNTENNVFEFNRQYKEPLVIYEMEQTYNNDTKQWDYTYTRNESDTEFIPSSDTILTKTPKDGDWSAGSDESPFDTTTEKYVGSLPPLVESVGYMKPDISIIVKNIDDPSSLPIIIKPNGGIDPLQWNEEKHKIEAEKIMKEKGKQDYFDSEEYKDAWDKKWKTIKDPRPWTERIDGRGNYSLEIDTQSIDSYNIQIMVPEAANTSYLPKIDQNYTLAQNEIKTVLGKFFDGFNAKPDSNYFTNITNFFVPDLATSDKIQPIYKSYVQTRASGVNVTDVVIDDILVRGNIGKDNVLIQAVTATAIGNLNILQNGFAKTIPFDIVLMKEPDGWKLKNAPEIRV